MKELSIEEKAKRYDEAIQRARNIVNSINVGLIGKDSFEAVFPELKESEDERIRESLLEYLHTLPNHYTHSGVCALEWISWLEKQGEHANFRNKIQIGDKVTRNEDGVLVNLSQLKRVAKKDEKQGEQKSYASETMNEKWDFDSGFTRMMEKEQKHAAWSEEDEQMVGNIRRIIEQYAFSQSAVDVNGDLCEKEYIDADNWLKSLKDRYIWKPSDEQMKALKHASNDCSIAFADMKILATLYEQLKALHRYEQDT